MTEVPIEALVSCFDITSEVASAMFALLLINLFLVIVIIVLMVKLFKERAKFRKGINQLESDLIKLTRKNGKNESIGRASIPIKKQEVALKQRNSGKHK